MAGRAAKEQMLHEAVQAGQTGDQARARKLLLKLLRTDNHRPLYWRCSSAANKAAYGYLCVATSAGVCGRALGRQFAQLALPRAAFALSLLSQPCWDEFSIAVGA